MSKGVIRSIRFSDELYELIDRQEGDTFTQKFENLVTKCVWELPRKQDELKYVQAQIRKEYAHLDTIRKKHREAEQAIGRLSGILNQATYTMQSGIKSLEALQEVLVIT